MSRSWAGEVGMTTRDEALLCYLRDGVVPVDLLISLKSEGYADPEALIAGDAKCVETIPF